MNKNVWAIDYRPEKIEDCILPDILKNKFKSFLREECIPDLILVGPPGIGKTTVAIAMLKEFGCDYMKINASLEKGVDTIRDKVLQFASTVSFEDKKKYVIFDEADGMSISAQRSLKAFIEEFSENCGYIFTCNNVNRIDDAIQSRCQTISFDLKKEDFAQLATSFYHRLEEIFKENDVKYDKKSVGLIIKKYFPDWRHILVVIQNYVIEHKEVNSGIFSSKEEDYSQLVVSLKNKRWTEVRKWVGENSYVCSDFITFGKSLLKQIEPMINTSYISIYIMRLNEYDFQNAFVTDKEINTIAFLTKIMNELIWL